MNGPSNQRTTTTMTTTANTSANLIVAENEDSSAAESEAPVRSSPQLHYNHQHDLIGNNNRERLKAVVIRAGNEEEKALAGDGEDLLDDDAGDEDEEMDEEEHMSSSQSSTSPTTTTALPQMISNNHQYQTRPPPAHVSSNDQQHQPHHYQLMDHDYQQQQKQHQTSDGGRSSWESCSDGSSSNSSTSGSDFSFSSSSASSVSCNVIVETTNASYESNNNNNNSSNTNSARLHQRFVAGNEGNGYEIVRVGRQPPPNFQPPQEKERESGNHGEGRLVIMDHIDEEEAGLPAAVTHRYRTVSKLGLVQLKQEPDDEDDGDVEDELDVGGPPTSNESFMHQHYQHSSPVNSHQQYHHLTNAGKRRRIYSEPPGALASRLRQNQGVTSGGISKGSYMPNNNGSNSTSYRNPPVMHRDGLFRKSGGGTNLLKAAVGAGSGRGRKPRAVKSQSESDGSSLNMKDRKKEQNKDAAKRYRLRKKSDRFILEYELQNETAKKHNLSAEIDTLTRQIECMKRCLRNKAESCDSDNQSIQGQNGVETQVHNNNIHKINNNNINNNGTAKSTGFSSCEMLSRDSPLGILAEVAAAQIGRQHSAV